MKMEVTLKNVVDFYEKYPEFKSKIFVETPFGFKKIIEAKQTDFSKPILIQTENNNSCISSLNHRFKIDEKNDSFEFAKKLKIGDKILGRFGLENIVNIKKFKQKIALYDIEVDDVHQYYSNNLVSHNSSIFIDSLVFALFGKTIKNTNNKYIPNRSMPTSLKPYVKLYFKSNDQLYSCETFGRIYGKIMGTVGMELLKLNDDYSVAEDLTQSSIAKTKQYIVDNLLGCSFNVFRSSVVMTSSDFTDFYEGMTKDQKRKYIETIFNLDCFGEMFSLLKTNINDIKKETSFLKTSLIALTNKLDDMKKKSENFEIEQKKKKDELKSQITKKYAEYTEASKKNDEFVLEDSTVIDDDYDKFTKEYGDVFIQKSKREKEIVRLSSDITHSQKMIEKMKMITEGLCESCTQLMNERYDYKENFDTIEQSKIQITKCNAEIDELVIKGEELSKKVSELRKRQIELNEQKSEKNDLVCTVKALKSELKSLKERYNEFQEESSNPYDDMIKSFEKDKNESIARLNEYLKNYKHLDILKEACSENGIKKFIIKDIVKLLNSLIQKYLNEIGCEFIVYFDETFDFKFITTTGECEFSSFSAGEKQRIQIATLFAFRDLILNGKITSNIFIIDELLDANVDTACIENVMNILKRKATESNQNIFMISHRSELADNMSFWNNILKVTKENQQSRYEIV